LPCFFRTTDSTPDKSKDDLLYQFSRPYLLMICFQGREGVKEERKPSQELPAALQGAFALLHEITSRSK